MDAAGSKQAEQPISAAAGEGEGGDENGGAATFGGGPAPGPVGNDPVEDGQAEDGQAEDGPAAGARMGLTPRQARRVRVVLASVMMAAMAVLLVVRLATRHSVLVVGVYGAALVLCGIVIELARNGRTRLGTWLLGLGLAAAIAADWLLLP
ncbi:hypothetical protein [Streptomyces noursei]|uniref:hypothetical protein n=2 Tax=Streptomyces noursei TaxID=1971 RepID=UPI0038306052